MCDCTETINEKLGPDHEIRPAILIENHQLVSRMSVPLYRKDTGRPETRRGKPTTMIATFCPFCGSPYKPPQPNDSATHGGTDGR